MLVKKLASIRNIAVVVCTLPFAAMAIHHYHPIDVTVAQLRHDMSDIRKYVMDRINNDLKRAKKYGKGMAKTFAGISSYTFDAIPFEFFSDQAAIDAAFKRVEQGVIYIQDKKEIFKRNVMGNKKKINQSQLGEFLYNCVVDNVHVTDEQRALLRKEPLKMDEFVRRGIVKKDEYMYYTLLNFVARYYLEHELKR